jgi:hypothetical protein
VESIKGKSAKTSIRLIHPPQHIPKNLSPFLEKFKIVPTVVNVGILKPKPKPLRDLLRLGKGFGDLLFG